jgi:hypothetical protein
MLDRNYSQHTQKYEELYKTFLLKFKELNYLILYLRIMAKEKVRKPVISWTHNDVKKFLKKYFEIEENLELNTKSFSELISFDQIQREFQNLGIDSANIKFPFIENELKQAITWNNDFDEKILNGHTALLFLKKFLSRIQKKIGAPNAINDTTNDFLFLLVAVPRTEIPNRLKQFLMNNFAKLEEA